MFTLKNYQKATLAALKEYLTLARIVGPKDAFERFVREKPTESRPQKYEHRWGMQDVPYVCLRLPTGGGKTVLASCAVDVAARTYMERDYPLVLWLVPTNTIRLQTAEALKKPFHPYREALDNAFGGADRVAVFDIADVNAIRPTDLSDKVCVVVATYQTLRVADSNKEKRKVYGNNENFEPHFKALPNTMPGLDKDEDGNVLLSFVNLMHQLRPLIIADEAHKAVSGLSGEMMQRINPACVLEFTATPVESNVLWRVYASELKAEEMVKLPFMLTEHADWLQAVNGAVQSRGRLDALAAQEAEYVRPILLIQAEKANQEHTWQAVKQHLIENEGVPESEIAVATGEQRELDGLDLFEKTCPIRYIITIEALKEGWDCSFAYVFCSVANIRSGIDVEQLLGRVMRMPYARRRKNPDLNKAYAHVISPSFANAAEEMFDKLSNMGFNEDEAAEAIQQQQPLPGLDLSSFPLLADAPPVFSLSLPVKPDLSSLPAEEREAFTVVPDSEGAFTVSTPGIVSPEAEALFIKAAKGEEARVRRAVALHGQRVRNAQAPTLSQQGQILTVPRLVVEVWGSLEVPEEETILVASDWSPLNFPAVFEPGEFDYDEQARTFAFDLEGERLRYQQMEGQTQYSLLASAESWSDLQLSRWLDRQCRQDNIKQSDLLEFCRRCVASLLHRGSFDLAVLCRAKYALAAALKSKLARLRLQALKQGYQSLLLAPQAKVETSFDYGFHFKPDSYPQNMPAYAGHFQFRKHFYPVIRDLKNKGQEFQCAQVIDGHAKVTCWVRNLDSYPLASFWLPLSNGHKFYPDFVAQLEDGRIMVVEFKGAHLEADAQEKKNIGELWERKSNGKALFWWATMLDATGRDMMAQIKAKIG